MKPKDVISNVPDPSQKIIDLFKEMYDLTLPSCQKECRVPLSCCDPLYCAVTAEYAMDEYGISLPVTGHPTLPYMGSEGCTVAPHLRPLCTMHTCDMNGVGVVKTDGKIDIAKTDKYFDLRERIMKAEAE